MGRGLSERVEDAQKHGLLHLSHLQLRVCPSIVFNLPDLIRLDLSFNALETIPDAIGTLRNLRTLWLHNNRLLTQLPIGLARCTQLRVLDASDTALQTLPCEIGRLEQLQTLAIDHTPLETGWITKKHISTTTDTRCHEILVHLRRKDARFQLKKQLMEMLRDEIYRIEKQDLATATKLRQVLHQHVFKLFRQDEELRGLYRNAARLFPASVLEINRLETQEAKQRLRDQYEKLRSENEMKKLGAELELKIRALYFDRIDVTLVEGMVHSIYREIHALKDIKFLLKHATQLFPADAKDVDGQQLLQKLRQLQDEIAKERAAAIDKLQSVVKAIYSDTEPEQVRKLITRVAALFKNTKELRSLTADATTLFPIEFLNANPNDIRAAFLRQKAEALGTTTAIAPTKQ